MKTKYVLITSIGALLLVLLVSLVLYFALGRRWERRVLFFPASTAALLTGEERFLPARRSLEGEVELLIVDMILGPADPDLRRVVPKGVRVRSVIARDSALYLDFSKELLFHQTETGLTLDQMMRAVTNTVLHNFPGVKKVYIYIEGQIPRGQYQEGIRFSPELMR